MEDEDEELDPPTREEEMRLRRGFLRRSKAMHYYQRKPIRPKARRRGAPPTAVRSMAKPSGQGPSMPPMRVVLPSMKETMVGGDEVLPSVNEPVVGSAEVLPSVNEPVVGGGEVLPSVHKAMVDGEEVLMVRGKPVRNIEELFDYYDPPYDPSIPDYLSSPGCEMRIWLSKKWARDEDLFAEMGAYKEDLNYLC